MVLIWPLSAVSTVVIEFVAFVSRAPSWVLSFKRTDSLLEPALGIGGGSSTLPLSSAEGMPPGPWGAVECDDPTSKVEVTEGFSINYPEASRRPSRGTRSVLKTCREQRKVRLKK